MPHFNVLNYENVTFDREGTNQNEYTVMTPKVITICLDSFIFVSLCVTWFLEVMFEEYIMLHVIN